MSRFRDWNKAFSRIEQLFSSKGFELDVINKKGIKNRYSGVEIPKIVNKYSREKGLKGSLTDRYLLIMEDFKSFRDWVSNNDFDHYKLK